jgi:hypothetical protein
MSDGVRATGGPAGIPLGPDTFLEPGTTKVAAGETTLKKLAERLYVTEKELRNANPGIKEPLKKDQEIRYPKNYMNDRSGIDHTNHTTHGNKKSKDTFEKEDNRRVNISDEGASLKVGGGSVKLTPGGSVVVSPPKIKGVQPQITREGVTPGIPSKDDPIPDPSQARHIPNDPKDPKMVEIEKKQQKENTEASKKKYDTVEARDQKKEEIKEAVRLQNERMKYIRP